MATVVVSLTLSAEAMLSKAKLSEGRLVRLILYAAKQNAAGLRLRQRFSVLGS